MSRVVRKRATQGFTLIELLVVLIILTVLALIVVPKFVGRSKEARISAAKTEISHISGALDTFETDNGRFPTSEEGLDALVNQPGNVTNWHKYLDHSPKDPWGRPYQYRCPGVHNPESYDLFCTGPDGNDSSGNDINNWSK